MLAYMSLVLGFQFKALEPLLGNKTENVYLSSNTLN